MQSGKSDIFALGLVFFFVLSKGRHVFGVTRSETRRNILNPAFQPIIMFNDAKWQAYKVIIQQMIQHDPTLRPACEDVLKNILGLSEKLCEVPQAGYVQTHKTPNRIKSIQLNISQKM